MKTQKGKQELYSFFNLGDRWSGWLTPHPGRSTVRKESLYTFYRKLGGPQDPFWTVAENITFPRESILGPSSTYTHYVIPTHEDVMYLSKVFFLEIWKGYTSLCALLFKTVQ